MSWFHYSLSLGDIYAWPHAVFNYLVFGVPLVVDSLVHEHCNQVVGLVELSEPLVSLQRPSRRDMCNEDVI